MDDSPLNLLPPELRNNIYKLVLSTGDIHVSVRTTSEQADRASITNQDSWPSANQAKEVDWWVPNMTDWLSLSDSVTRCTTTATASAHYALFMTCKQIYAESKGYRSRDLREHTLRFDLEYNPAYRTASPPAMRASYYVEWRSCMERREYAASSQVLTNWAQGLLRDTASYPQAVMFDFGICYRGEGNGILSGAWTRTSYPLVNAVASVFSQTPTPCFLHYRIAWPNAAEKYRTWELLVPYHDQNARVNTLKTKMETMRQEIKDAVRCGEMSKADFNATFAYIYDTKQWLLPMDKTT